MRAKNGLEKHVIILLYVIVVLFVIAFLYILLPYVLYLIGYFFKKYNLKIFEPSIVSDYSVFTSFLALAFAIVVATPYFISKKEISTEKSVEYKKIDDEIFKLSSFRDNSIEYKTFLYKKILIQVFEDQEIENKKLSDYVNKIN